VIFSKQASKGMKLKQQRKKVTPNNILPKNNNNNCAKNKT
jgi:hypothetical protein